MSGLNGTDSVRLLLNHRTTERLFSQQYSIHLHPGTHEPETK